MINRLAIRVLVILTLFFGMTGPVWADPPPVEKSRDENAQRLKFMKDSVAAYVLAREGENPMVPKLQPDPAFRLGKQGDGVVMEGAIFFGPMRLAGPGRPPRSSWLRARAARWGVAARIHFARDRTVHSGARGQAALAADGGRRFVPADPGWPRSRPLLPRRVAQMRDLAAEFRAEDDFWGRGWTYSACYRHRSAATAKQAAHPKTVRCSPLYWGPTPSRSSSSRHAPPPTALSGNTPSPR